MALICLKWHMYLGIDWSVWETSKICEKWRRSVLNSSNTWGNDLIIWQTALKCGIWLRDLGNGQNIWEMA